MRIAVVPGTFDPVTLGHVDIAVRAAQVFDKVVVAVARNASKSPLLTAQERCDAFASAVRHVGNIEVAIAEGLLVDFCRQVGARAIVKGLRSGIDLNHEAPMAAVNRHLTGVETLFLVSSGDLSHISSTIVRDVASYGGPIDDLVPPGVAQIVRARIDRQEQQ